MVRRNNPVLLLLLILAAACGRPSGNYHFISTETARENGGAFDFVIVSDDSSAVFATTLAARIIGSRIPEESIEFDIHLTPPDGQPTIERHVFPLTDAPGVKHRLGPGSVTDYEWSWHDIRTGGHPAGKWTVRIMPADPSRLEALYGVGFSYETK